jgi:hypothetical protein
MKHHRRGYPHDARAADACCANMRRLPSLEHQWYLRPDGAVHDN